jgi:hypothetical protein
MSLTLAAAHADEAGVGVVAFGFAKRDFLVGLRVGHAAVNALHDLLLSETGVLEAADFTAGKRRLLRKLAVQEHLDRRIGKADEPERNGFRTDGLELAGTGEFENLGLGKAGADEALDGIRAVKEMVLLVRHVDESHASIIRNAGCFQSHQLGDFWIRNIQLFELLDGIGPHTRLIERTIVS